MNNTNRNRATLLIGVITVACIAGVLWTVTTVMANLAATLEGVG